MRNLSIQGLRGIAALVVFFSHALLIPELHLEEIKQSPLHLFFDGQISVIIFIVLSGFFYYNKSVTRFSDYITVVKKKALRIYLPYLFITVIAFLLLKYCSSISYNHSNFTDWGNSFWGSDVSAIELLKQCTVLWPHNADLINPPSWYLAIEVRLFLIIPLLLMLDAKCPSLNKLIMIVFIGCMGIGVMKFVGACLCGYFSHMIMCYFNKQKPLILNTRYLKLLLSIVALFLLNINNEFAISERISYVLQALGASILVAVAYNSSIKLLTNKIIVWFGNISYELYLVHFVVLLALRPWYHNGLSYIMLSLSITLIVSFCINKLCSTIIKTIESSKK